MTHRKGMIEDAEWWKEDSKRCEAEADAYWDAHPEEWSNFNSPQKPVQKSFSMSGCNHWRHRVAVGRYTVTMSSYSGTKELRGESRPDFGIYLYSGWRDKHTFTTNGCSVKAIVAEAAYPMIFAEIPDMGILNPRELDILVGICLSKMRHGKSIDIACHAGHGRAGFILACLIARVEHLSGRRAIEEARRRYCSHAVESLKQEQAVIDYAKRQGYDRRGAK
jgi:protein-tyrosine phosphatase